MILCKAPANRTGDENSASKGKPILNLYNYLVKKIIFPAASP
jgi:hypothetical protein